LNTRSTFRFKALNRCAVVPRGNVGATLSCIFEEVRLRHHGGLLAAAVPLFHIAKELPMTVLRQRMMEDMQLRNLSPHTQASYVQQVSLFARHFAKSPDVLAPEHIRTYQIYLTNERKLAAGSIHIAVAALRFLYKIFPLSKFDWMVVTISVRVAES
jgi:hypothetical protein